MKQKPSELFACKWSQAPATTHDKEVSRSG